MCDVSGEPSAVTGPSEGEGKGGIARSIRRRVDLMCVFAEGVHRTAHSCCIVYLLNFCFYKFYLELFLNFALHPRVGDSKAELQLHKGLSCHTGLT